MITLWTSTPVDTSDTVDWLVGS